MSSQAGNSSSVFNTFSQTPVLSSSVITRITSCCLSLSSVTLSLHVLLQTFTESSWVDKQIRKWGVMGLMHVREEANLAEEPLYQILFSETQINIKWFYLQEKCFEKFLQMIFVICTLSWSANVSDFYVQQCLWQWWWWCNDHWSMLPQYYNQDFYSDQQRSNRNNNG